jgi:hypothetical protein
MPTASVRLASSLLRRSWPCSGRHRGGGLWTWPPLVKGLGQRQDLRCRHPVDAYGLDLEPARRDPLQLNLAHHADKRLFGSPARLEQAETYEPLRRRGASRWGDPRLGSPLLHHTRGGNCKDGAGGPNNASKGPSSALVHPIN